jgi:NADPH-dependent ferric siderophore reductase
LDRFFAARVIAARLLAPAVRHVTLASGALEGAALPPGADVAIRFENAEGRVEERHYSSYRHGGAAVEICVVLHGKGAGSLWAARCAPGDALEIALPRAVPIALDHSAPAHLFLGDETSVATAEAMTRALPQPSVHVSVFEVAAPAQRWPDVELVDAGTVRWIERSGRPGAALLSWLAGAALPEPATAYVTGEAWLCAAVQTHLVRERGFSGGAVRAMPYWKRRA